MSGASIRWQAGEEALRVALDRALPGMLETTAPLHAGRHRRLYRLRLDAPVPNDVVVKHYLPPVGRRRLREVIKRVAGRTPARREWRALEWLHGAGLPVPKPLAWGEGAKGEAFVVTERLSGETLAEALAEAEGDGLRRKLVALAETVEALHGRGIAHGDLHLGNLWWGPEGVLLLDVGESRPIRGPKDAALDRARLELSLARSLPDRRCVDVLRAVWPAMPDLDAHRIGFLRDYLRGRARRRLRIGRSWRRARAGPARGLRDQRLSASRLELALAACGALREDGGAIGGESRRRGRVAIHRIPATRDDSALVVKRVDAGSFGRALADRFRGSAARRAFRAGQRRRLLDESCAPALACLDETRLGLPVRSWLILESVGREDLDRHRPASPAQATITARALGHWLATQHAAGLGHRDLKGGNVRIDPGATASTEKNGGAPRFFLLDLEDLTGPAPISATARQEALVQLNASLADEAFDVRARRAALDAYAARLPFDEPLERVARRIVSRSLARAHRWRGDAAVSQDGEARSRVSSSEEPDGPDFSRRSP